MGQGKHLLPKIQVMPPTVDREGVKRARPLRAARPSGDGDSGASLVEFALVLPVFMMVLLGMFTGGLAYSRKLSIAQAAREGARYGATLPVSGSIDTWLTNVSDLVMASGDGELAPTRPGQTICVAYVTSAGVARSRQQVGTAVAFTDAPCLTGDGRNETRVQVLAGRTSTLQALVFSRELVLRSHAVARHEAP